MTLALNLRQPAVEAAHGIVFDGTPQQRAAQLCAYLAETAVERDVAGGTPYAQRQAVRDSGLLSLWIPQQWGGLGANWAQTYQIIRQIAR